MQSKNTGESEHRPPSGYFLSLSQKYKNASHIICIALVVSFLVVLVFNAKMLTYTNFSYLIRDLNSAAEVAEDNYSSIPYTNNEMRVVKSYRGGIVTASGTDIAIYTATGRKTLYASENFVAPEIAVSKKYAIVYDLGGNKYSVYNSFAKLYSETFDYPISYVTVADNGWFAVVTNDASHFSVVNLYDDDFNIRNTYYFSSAYVMFADINPKGDKIAICKTETKYDKFSTSLMMATPGKDDKIFDVSVSEGIPCGGSFLSNGDFQLVCTDGYRLINSGNGKITEHHGFDDRKVSRVSFNGDGTVVCLSNNIGMVRNFILVFDKKGKIVYTNDVNKGILDMEYSNGYVFVNHGDSISKMNIENDDVVMVEISEKGSDIIVYDGNNILLCCDTKAKYIKI